MMITNNVSKINAFGEDDPGQNAVEDFSKEEQRDIKYTFVKRVGLYRTLELASCAENYLEQSRVCEKYNRIFENLASFILDDSVTGDTFRFQWTEEVGSFPVTEALKQYLQKYKGTLLKAGFIRRTDYPPQCIVTGEFVQPGELFLQISGGSPEAIRLSACDDGNMIDVNTVVCCYVQ